VSDGDNDPDRFDRLPATPDERRVEGRPARSEVVGFFEERYGIPPAVFEGRTFWEKGAGKLWAFAGAMPDPCDVEGLGMVALRTRQEHWKPTLEAAQRFGGHATRNVLHLDGARAKRFLAREDQRVEWDGDWGYLIVSHDLAGAPEPLGVGLYLRGELRSQVPKGRSERL